MNLPNQQDPAAKPQQPDADREHVVAPTPSAKRTRIFIVAGAFVLLLALCGVFYWIASEGREETSDAYVAGHIHSVSSRVPGTVESVGVDDNQAVTQGQMLVRLDPHDFELKVQQAQAALEVAKQQAATSLEAISLTTQNADAGTTEARATVEQADAGVATAQSGVAQAQAGLLRAKAMLAQADANLEQTEKDNTRYADLLARQQVSRQQYDHAHAAYLVALGGDEAAKTGVRDADSNLDHARASVRDAQAARTKATGGVVSAKASYTDVDVHKSQYQASQAMVAAAQAALDDAKLQLSYTSIAAPVNGTVGSKTVEAGQRLQPGQPLLAVVEPEIWVVANYKETQLNHMRGGQAVEIKLDSLPDKVFRGRLQSVSPASGAQFSLLPPDNATGNFVKIVQRVPVKIVFDPDSIRGYEKRIAPGLSAVVTVRVR